LGRTFPTNTNFRLFLSGAHRNPKYFKDPLVFNPDRWSDPETKDLPMFGFSAGPRVCIGKKLSLNEMKVLQINKIMVVHFFQKYKMSLVKDQNILITHRLTSTFEYGLMVNLAKRED
jgi:cytochrome P450